MLPRELQAITVNPDGSDDSDDSDDSDGSDGSDRSDGAPGMRLNQIGKKLLSLFLVHLIGKAIEMPTDPVYNAQVGGNGPCTFTLDFDQTRVTLVKLIKSFCFGFGHGMLLSFYRPKLRDERSYTLIWNIFDFFSRHDSGFVKQLV